MPSSRRWPAPAKSPTTSSGPVVPANSPSGSAPASCSRCPIRTRTSAPGIPAASRAPTARPTSSCDGYALQMTAMGTPSLGVPIQSAGSQQELHRELLSLARRAALHALAEAPLHSLVGRLGLLLDAFAEAAALLELRLRAGAHAAREVGLELLVRCVGLVVDALGEAGVGVLRSGGVLVLEAFRERVLGI